LGHYHRIHEPGAAAGPRGNNIDPFLVHVDGTALGIWRTSGGVTLMEPVTPVIAPVTAPVIAPDERTMAALTHLSGLAGYVIPLGGAIVPIVIWMVRKDSPIISTIAKQALWLNLMFYILFGAAAILMLTVILIPFVFAFWAVLGIAAVVLPIIGAIKANQGTYYKYPVLGLSLA
jgi:uncharacterized Tic20 family protein